MAEALRATSKFPNESTGGDDIIRGIRKGTWMLVSIHVVTGLHRTIFMCHVMTKISLPPVEEVYRPLFDVPHPHECHERREQLFEDDDDGLHSTKVRLLLV